MQLDRTHIAIRVRTLSEIGDLSLLMIRRYPTAITRAFFFGAAPWILINTILLGFLPVQIASDEFFTDDSLADLIRYLTWMLVLVVLQTPLAGIFATFYLGQAVFEQQPTLKHTFREIRGMARPLIWVLGFKRLAIPTVIFLAFRIGSDSDPFLDFVLPWMILLFVAVIRSNRPFVAEMMVLERCPLKSKNPQEITLPRRSKGLHSPMSSELGGRFLTVSATLGALVACVYYSLIWVRGVATNGWEMDLTAMLVFFPLALWLVASLSIVVRLLGYLDARIRLEGWEVELAIRAEAIRQFGEDAMSSQTPQRPDTSRPATNRPRDERSSTTEPKRNATADAAVAEAVDDDTVVGVEVTP